MRKPSFLSAGATLVTTIQSTGNVPKADPTGGSGSLLCLMGALSAATTGYNTPSGFLIPPSPYAASLRMSLFYKILDGTEGSTFSLTATASGMSMRAWTVIYQDVDPDDPFAGIGPVFQAASGTSTIIPSINVQDFDNTRLFSMAMRTGTTAAVTKPASMTQDVQTNTSSALAVAREDVAAGATGTRTWTWSGSSVVPAVLYALKAPQEQFVGMM